MKSYQIHFIRHGITEANESGQYIGLTDVELSQEGKQQLEQLSKEYSYPGIGVLYTSPLKRCIQTCNILYPDIKPVQTDGLKECSFGEWEGKTAKDLETDEQFKLWLNDSAKNSPPGGENGMQFAYRVCSSFENIVKDMMKSGKTSAGIVTHAGVITTILSAYGLPRANAFEWMVEHGYGYSIRIIPMLWMRDMVAEVYDKIPVSLESDKKEKSPSLFDIAREAADRAYGSNDF